MAYPWKVMLFHRSCSLLSRPSNSRGDIKTNKMSSLKYFHKVIKRVNERDNEHEIQTINLCTGLVKVSILSNNCSMQSDPRLA